MFAIESRYICKCSVRILNLTEKEPLIDLFAINAVVVFGLFKFMCLRKVLLYLNCTNVR